ncbi:D-2-hydroxyacid dehydrogenase [Paludicola sp. MB14-C6]|uniref:D-2-hydroxyacid dehydrogenase n=1 Tax=Paludihabitans sp. MB14-C6 TaxID=3070656 RepID=UPI0027DB438E|nr:D-2-hydroxyacid dehydrogenase [Paludicola sp. MB14-C6]WMJ24275.1 D-2-hydroxyacid dehydrogenase [Paludicola sp. MB14-C6]
MKLVVLDSYAAVSNDLSLDCLNKYCDEMTVYDRTLPQDTVVRIGNAEMVIVNKTLLHKEVLEQCPNLKYIGLFATGYNIIDIDYCKEHGIVVANAPAYSTSGVAQLTFAFLMHFYNKVDQHNNEVHNGMWTNCQDFCFYDKGISELMGKTIGLIGFGSIAKQVARIAQAFDMRVLVSSRTRYPEYESNTLRFVDMNTLLKNSDIISIHCPLFPETRNLINQEAIDKMKPNAILINTARGPIIDEKVVAKALNEGRIAGAGVDVVSAEPIKADNPLLSAKNCVITPHIAWAGKETRARLIQIVAENLKNFVLGNPSNNVAK